ncbi:putative ergot alkaloid A [Whalleya microplaca]|nr:putative ergot alkaloid A [Whalleya microplaca]
MASSTPTQPGTVLLLGGTGKVASRIAPLLQAANIPSQIASRSGSAPAGFTGVKFDWKDESTWAGALSASPPVSAVFIVAQGVMDSVPTIQAFIDLAVSRGVARFVLLSATIIPEDGPMTGQVHRYLRELGDQGKISWGVLRPTWFQENFSEQEQHLRSLKDENKIYSSTGPGRIPWVSASDIAGVGFAALTAPEPPNRDYLIVGPDLLTYNELAETFASVLGRPITYHELTEPELSARFQSFGVPAEYAPVLAAADGFVRQGGEERTNGVVEEVTGRAPRRFRDFVEANRGVWS